MKYNKYMKPYFYRFMYKLLEILNPLSNTVNIFKLKFMKNWKHNKKMYICLKKIMNMINSIRILFMLLFITMKRIYINSF